MARGGARPGSGAKPGVKKKPKLSMRVVRGAFGLPEPPTVPPVDAEGLLEPPADLPDSDRDAWRALAPHGLLEGTLTASRVAGFRVLCKRWVYCAELDARVRLLGIVSAEADRVMKRLEVWEKLLGASLGEYSLRSFGKRAVAEKPKAAANPWASIASKA